MHKSTDVFDVKELAGLGVDVGKFGHGYYCKTYQSGLRISSPVKTLTNLIIA